MDLKKKRKGYVASRGRYGNSIPLTRNDENDAQHGYRKRQL